MFTEMQNDCGRIITKMDMEMIFEKSFFVAEMIQENTGQRHASEELVPRPARILRDIPSK
jgi:hypothetical protein